MASQPVLSWSDLSANTVAALAERLRGLFGWDDSAGVFESLDGDRQQSLLLLMQRFQELNLWQMVGRITNVYGAGGVGIDFIGSTQLRERIIAEKRFSSFFAGHRNNEGGFRERRKDGGPVLHVVMVELSRDRWAAHFDLYNPLHSPLSLWCHIYRESFRGERPRWQDIGGPVTS